MANALESTGQQRPLASVAGERRCQWCGATLPARALRCPGCGSGVSLDDEPMATTTRQAADAPQNTRATEAAPVNDVWAVPPVTAADTSAAEDEINAPTADDSSTRMLLIAGAIVLVCVLLGALLLPYLIVDSFRDITGVESARPGNLRGLGALIGVFAGVLLAMLFGAISWGTRILR